MQKLIFIIMLLLSSTAFPQQADDACDSPYEIIYSNGVLNNAGNIIDGRNALSSMVGAKFNGTIVYYGVNPNESDGLLDDVITVYAQKLSENPTWSWQMLSRVAAGFTQNLAPDIVDAIQAVIGSVRDQTSPTLNAKFQAKYAYVDDRVSAAVSHVTDAIVNQGRRVLLVAHSQGNLYANATYRLVYANPKIKPGNMKIVGIANVANFVADGGEYVTSSSDLVVKALRYAIPQVLPANIETAFNPNDLSGHLLLDTYLNPDFAARSAIFGMIQRTLPNLREPDSSYAYAINLVEYRVYGNADPSKSVFLPQIWCSGQLKNGNYCEDSSFNGYIRDPNGVEYDPHLQPVEFGAAAAAAMAKIQPFAPEVTNPDSAIARIITAQWPRVMSFESATFDMNGNQVGPSKYAAIDYDANMNFLPLPPADYHIPDASQYVEVFPVANTVHETKLLSPLMQTIQNLKGKVSFDEGDLEIKNILDLPQYGILITRVKHDYRLRICRNFKT